MKNTFLALALIPWLAGCGGSNPEPEKTSTAAPPKKEMSAADLEKEKARAHPFPSDLGPETVDVSGASTEIQEGLAALRAKCSTCHSAARPLNHRFTEPSGKGKAGRAAAVEKLKNSQPALFAEAEIWQVESNVWERYVKRMMAKPGCTVTKDDAKKIWKFLVWQSETQKIGKNASSWRAHRQSLIAEFKEKHPKRYHELADHGGL